MDGNAGADEMINRLLGMEVNLDDPLAAPPFVGLHDEDIPYDITLAASHSYMGSGLVTVGRRRVLEAGWRGRVPAATHRNVVFPGETVPLLLRNQDSAHLDAIIKDRLFVLMFNSEEAAAMSKFGVVCEVLEAGRPSAGVPQLTLLARAINRCRVLEPVQSNSTFGFLTKMTFVEVMVLPEAKLPAAPAASRLAALSARPPPRTALDNRLRHVDSLVTPWPLFVYDQFNYVSIRRKLQEFFASMKIENLPEEPLALSFWVASNLSLGARDQLALFSAGGALERLHLETALISQKCNLHCETCLTEIAKCDHLFPMSSEGLHTNYTNLSIDTFNFLKKKLLTHFTFYYAHSAV